MSYSAYETGRATGSPMETYLFTYGLGPTEYYAYTDSERDFVLEGKTYTAIPITRDSIQTSGGRTERKDIKVRMPAKADFLNLFQIYPPDQAISILIRAGHREDSTNEFLSQFTGRVINVTTKRDGWAEVLCRPLWTAAQQAGLRRHYQIGCPHILYGSHCKAAVTSVSATLSSLPSINKVQLATGWQGAYSPTKFRGGYVQWSDGSNTPRRTILSVSGDVLTLSGPVLDISAGHAMTVVIGCNRQMDDCLNIHGNIHNFGGHPWIPTQNPINKNPFTKGPQ